MIPLERLLAPVSADSPTGSDASATGLLLELEALIQGRPETQFAPAEEPNWRTASARCLEVATSTRDLRVGALLTTVLLRTEGLSGLHDGLKLIHGYVAQYWPTVHPQLDQTDDNDPQERINALNNLAAPLGTDGDLLRIIEVLRKTPLVESPQTGHFGLAAWLAVKNLAPWSEADGPVPSLAIIEGTRKDSNPEKLAADAAAASGCLLELSAITDLFRDFAGPSNLPSFEPLRKDLQQIVTWIGVTPDEASPDGSATGASGVAADGRAYGGGEIRSREDVVQALEAIIRYYQAHEPSSPVPFLLQRVKRVVPLNFMDVIRELSPESIEKLVVLTGPIDGQVAS
jgi:type VI secretion system protein ImpA